VRTKIDYQGAVTKYRYDSSNRLESPAAGFNGTLVVQCEEFAKFTSERKCALTNCLNAI